MSVDAVTQNGVVGSTENNVEVLRKNATGGKTREKDGVCLIDLVKFNRTGLLVTKVSKNEVKRTKALINILWGYNGIMQDNVPENIQDPEEIENVQAPEESEILSSEGNSKKRDKINKID